MSADRHPRLEGDGVKRQKPATVQRQGGSTLTDRQLDGYACVRCGDELHAMVPVGRGSRGQLFECSRHHKVVTVERQGGYAARCGCGGITFGGFSTRSEARAALTHENATALVDQDGREVTSKGNPS